MILAHFKQLARIPTRHNNFAIYDGTGFNLLRDEFMENNHHNFSFRKTFSSTFGDDCHSLQRSSF